MISVICKEGRFLAKGTFSIGIAGTFENKDYGEGNIEIELNLNDMVNDLDSDYYWIKPLKPVFEGISKDGDSIAKAFEDYYNGKEQMIKNNVKQINDYFWYQLILNFADCGYPFWETEEAVLPEYRGKCSQKEFEDIYNNEEINNAIYALCGEFDKTPNNGSMEKTDVEGLARKLFPMFNFDGLKQSINPDGLNLHGCMIQVQFSDSWGYNFFCSAYEEFDENLTPCDWHNF